MFSVYVTVTVSDVRRSASSVELTRVYEWPVLDLRKTI